MDPRLTIAIPIHAGARWIDGILDTISKAPDWSRIVISDGTHRDDAADQLAELCRDDDRVEVVSRPGTLDWIQNANLLLEEAATEYFCWMPQDDLVDPDSYFELLVDALDHNPGRVLAFPTVSRKMKVGWWRNRSLGEVAYRSPPFELGCAPPEEEALRMLKEWNPALGCWRGVFRTREARPAPSTNDSADLIWAFSMALAGNFIEVGQARYLKRFHRGSALRSMRWQGRSKAMGLYRAEVEARLGPDPAAVERVMSEVGGFLYRHRVNMALYPMIRAGSVALNRPRPVLE